MNKYPPQNIAPSIISQPKAKLILKSYGLSALKTKAYGDIQQEDEDAPDGTSRFGKPIFDNVIFLEPKHFQFKIDQTTGKQIKFPRSYGGNTIVDDNGTQQAETDLVKGDFGLNSGKSINNALKIDTVLIEIYQQRNIITTPIAGAPGAIKEYINEGDFQIKMRGFLDSGVSNKYPELEAKLLADYLSAPIGINVVSNYLRVFGIYAVVITGYSMPQTEGRRNLQFFEIDAVSEFFAENQFIKTSNA